jgi:hypothetical protein
MAASERRKKLLLRGAALAIVIAVIGVGVSNAAAWRRAARDDGSPDTLTLRTAVPQSGANATATLAAAAPAVIDTEKAPPAVTPGTATAISALAPIIALGETALGNGVTATRGDSGVVVFFDTPELRTRIPEKFERFLRATLPRIYGPSIEPFLAGVPSGKLAGQGELLYGLPTRGIQVPVQPGWRLDIYPETRPGRDGPLVIRYRAKVVRN